MDKTDANAANPAPELPEIVRAKLEALQGHTNSGVAIYRAEADGEDFVFVDFNRAAERIEQVSRSELIGKSVSGCGRPAGRKSTPSPSTGTNASPVGARTTCADFPTAMSWRSTTM
jgi:hypothetical protein